MSERIGIAGGGAIACGPGVRRGRARPSGRCGRGGRDAATAQVETADREARRHRRGQRHRVRRPGRRSATRRSSSRRSPRRRARRRSSWRGLGGDGDATGRSSPRRPRRCRSPSWRRRPGRPDRFVGLHVFNPVPKMDLVELVFPAEADEETRSRARALCAALGKTAVEVPDTPGFVVNRLLFPFLFDAVALLERDGPRAAGDRRLHAPGRRAPDGPAGPARLRRARRRRPRSAARSAPPCPRASTR